MDAAPKRTDEPAGAVPKDVQGKWLSEAALEFVDQGVTNKLKKPLMLSMLCDQASRRRCSGIRNSLTGSPTGKMLR
jgi:hypothetical protein